MFAYLVACSAEICGNGLDDDGDGWVDCADVGCARLCDSDRDGRIDLGFGGDDCNDFDPAVFPGAVEVCDGVDDDCDGAVDVDDPDLADGARVVRFADADGDGWGDAGARVCPGTGGYAARPGDCDEADQAVHPAAIEVCDGVDDDCDGLVDLDDPDVASVAVFTDADGDGRGDPRTATWGCPVDGLTLAAGDCDDTDPNVFVGASEICDGADDDCDGVAGADELDGDGDGEPGCSDCDDADPERSWWLQERCGPLPVDDDCDGLVDFSDPSLDVYSCGVCPASALYDPTVVDEETWNPCALDPAATALCSTDPDAPDTHTQGERLHRVAWRTDQGFWRDPLLLFLPPGEGRHNDKLRSWAAWAGYRYVSLGYPNDDGLRFKCTGAPESCFQDAMYETAWGVELSSWVDVAWPDSIERRLEVLLEHLAREHPDVGFDAFLLGDGTVDWSRVVVVGWSGGGSQAAFIAQYEPVSGVLMMSAPKDHHEEPLAPADWVTAPSVTPGCAMLATWHADEPFSPPPEDILGRAWDLLGVPAAAWDIDAEGLILPPDGTARLSQSLPVAELPMGCTAHGAVGDDDCLRDELRPAYLWMLCEADDRVHDRICTDP